MKSYVRPGERPVARDRLEHARRRRPHGEHPLGRRDPLPGVAARRGTARRGARAPRASSAVQRPERVEPDVERDALDVEPREQLRREVEPGRRRGGRARLARRRPSGSARGRRAARGCTAAAAARRAGSPSRRTASARRRATRAARRPAVASSVSPPPAAGATDGRAPPRRRRRARSSRSTSTAPPVARRSCEARGNDPGVVDDDELAAELVGQLGERPMPDVARRAVVDEQPRRVARVGRMLRDQLRRKVVVELVTISSDGQSSLAAMDEQALERAQQRIAEARADGHRGTAVRGSAASARARRSRRSAHAPHALEASLPEQVGEAVRTASPRGASRSAATSPRSKGCVNQAIRRLERLEQELLAERNARIDDLGAPRRPRLVRLARRRRAPRAGWSAVSRARRRRSPREHVATAFVAPHRGREQRRAQSGRPRRRRWREIGTSASRTFSGSSPRSRRWSSSR